MSKVDVYFKFFYSNKDGSFKNLVSFIRYKLLKSFTIEEIIQYCTEKGYLEALLVALLLEGSSEKTSLVIEHILKTDKSVLEGVLDYFIGGFGEEAGKYIILMMNFASESAVKYVLSIIEKKLIQFKRTDLISAYIEELYNLLPRRIIGQYINIDLNSCLKDFSSDIPEYVCSTKNKELASLTIEKGIYYLCHEDLSNLLWVYFGGEDNLESSLAAHEVFLLDQDYIKRIVIPFRDLFIYTDESFNEETSLKRSGQKMSKNTALRIIIDIIIKCKNVYACLVVIGCLYNEINSLDDSDEVFARLLDLIATYGTDEQIQMFKNSTVYRKLSSKKVSMALINKRINYSNEQI